MLCSPSAEIIFDDCLIDENVVPFTEIVTVSAETDPETVTEITEIAAGIEQDDRGELGGG